MKKQLLTTALSSLLCFSVHADNTPPSAPADNTTAPVTQTTQETTTTAPTAQETTTTAPTAGSSLPTAPQPLPVINCDYPIPATTTTIDQSIISSWAEKAAIQTFDFNPTNIDTQLEKLKACFTDQGWQGYHDALDKSGNINSIKTQNLTVSSQITGEIKINPIKENQWKVTLPMTVLYQNDKEKITQHLSVDLLISRKVSGNLGIMQVIASPSENAAAPTPAPAETPEATQ